MSVSLKVEEVSKSYDKNQALHKVSMTINKGEFVCLLGPSGCGKSTLLRLIAGLDKPNEGKIYINDNDVTHMPPAKRKYGIMFQSYALFPNLTAYENVAYGLRNKKVSNASLTQQVNALFEMIHLKEAMNKYPLQLSGGEQQRIALARALATNPDFLLLDEPLSALDAKVRLSLRQQICEIQKRMKLTTIMVTHDQDEALTMADRIIVMNKATIVQEGTPEQIYEQPRSLFVADFIGTINFIQREKKLLKLPIQKDVLAIRPEKIRISHTWTKESIHAKVKQIEFRGSYYRIAARTQLVEDNVKLLIDLQVTQFAEMQLREGDNMYLTIPQEHMLHFDKE